MHLFKFCLQATVFISVFTFFQIAPATARTLSETPYPTELVWSTAVRFLRVDLRFPVLEKDKEAGYILFDYQQDSKVYKASLELVAFEEPSGRSATRLAVSVPDLPRHVEATLLEKLARKIKEELGSPAPVRKRPNKNGNAENKDEADKPKREDKQPSEEDDPNQPIRGNDGLPRLPTRELPRPKD